MQKKRKLTEPPVETNFMSFHAFALISPALESKRIPCDARTRTVLVNDSNLQINNRNDSIHLQLSTFNFFFIKHKKYKNNIMPQQKAELIRLGERKNIEKTSTSHHNSDSKIYHGKIQAKKKKKTHKLK